MMKTGLATTIATRCLVLLLMTSCPPLACGDESINKSGGGAQQQPIVMNNASGGHNNDDNGFLGGFGLPGFPDAMEANNKTGNATGLHHPPPDQVVLLLVRAISDTLGPINATQAVEIHKHLKRSVFPETSSNEEVKTPGGAGDESSSPTDEIKTTPLSVTPEGATGKDWIFTEGEKNSSNNYDNSSSSGDNHGNSKRSVLQTDVRMFSSERACGFAMETKFGVVYPWMATVKCLGTVQCTGSLVSSTFVLVSGKCIQACGTSPVTISMGDNSIFRPTEFQAESAVFHPHFASSSSAASGSSSVDMALIRLSTAIDFNVYPWIYPICLTGVEVSPEDSSIKCEVVLGGFAARQPQQQQQPYERSFVNCYQPGNQFCIGLGISSACVHLNNCLTTPQPPSMPVICHRTNRFFLWGLTTSAFSNAGSCTNSVVRVSPSFQFLVGTLGF